MTDEWLSLKDVAQLLGVHPGTIRLWSNKGILPVHLTNGGHRRYLSNEIKLWQAVNRQQVDPGEIMQSVIRNVHIQIAEGKLEAETWYGKLDAEARTQYRQSARSLFHGLMAFIASNENSSSESHAIGYEYASHARRHGLSFTDAARAFLFFRNALIESVMDAYQQANVPAKDALQRILVFTDNVLINLLETYQMFETGY